MATPPLRILLIGSGGREHALAWKLGQSPSVESIIVVPGNGGTAACAKTVNETSVAPDDYEGLVKLALARSVNLVVPAPDAPLVDGIEGYFGRIGVGIPVFGPTKEAARLEGSKAFSKDFMKRHRIPTAEYETFTDHDQAAAYVKAVRHDVVIKASGLAAGKGVIMPASRQEALDGLRSIMIDKAFGPSGDEVVVEQFLDGQELSIISFCDGTHLRSFPAAQDHKRILDGDRGPNTGGMGCYSPTRIVTRALLDRIDDEILRPTLAGMRRENRPFRGVLFTGLMITSDGPKVLEYNVRFGDPEAQTLLPLLRSDLAEMMLACVRGTLDFADVRLEPRFSATVVVAAGGYPGTYVKGTPMTLKAAPPGVTLFHAGTELVADGRLRTSGGRVIAINAVADTLEAAVELAYEGVKCIGFEGMYYRRDIAHRAFSASPSPPPQPRRPEPLTYAQAGVDIDAGNAFVEHIKKVVASTRRAGADAEIGGFGGEIDLAECGFPGLPILAGAIDGVGTKLAVAQAMGKHHGVGIDLVAMNVNDLVVQGAEPLIFLDYYGCSQLNKTVAAEFVEGVADGCRQAGCALVGGETAEMPGMYRDDDYDAAGAAVGALMRENRLPQRDAMAEGDVLLGLVSSGLHSNGFSLVRRILQVAGVALTGPAPWAVANIDEDGSTTTTTTTTGDSLLTPTRIYVRALLPLVRAGLVKGMAHITGGGLVENVPRMLPPGLAARIDIGAWEIPRVFKWLQAAGNVAPAEMCRTFNNGIGMVLAVDPARADEVLAALAAGGEKGVVRMGNVVWRGRDAAACELVGLDDAAWA